MHAAINLYISMLKIHVYINGHTRNQMKTQFELILLMPFLQYVLVLSLSNEGLWLSKDYAHCNVYHHVFLRNITDFSIW